MEVAAHVEAVGAGALELAQVAVQEVDPLRVVDLPVQRDPVGVAIPFS